VAFVLLEYPPISPLLRKISSTCGRLVRMTAFSGNSGKGQYLAYEPAPGRVEAIHGDWTAGPHHRCIMRTGGR
jgi:hypothetical protein